MLSAGFLNTKAEAFRIPYLSEAEAPPFIRQFHKARRPISFEEMREAIVASSVSWVLGSEGDGEGCGVMRLPVKIRYWEFEVGRRACLGRWG